MRTILQVLLIVLAVAGCTARESTTGGVLEPAAVSGGAGTTGGTVTASEPSVPAFASDRTTGDNSGSFAVVLGGTAFSPNGEKRLERIEVAAQGPSGLGANHTITAAELDARSEPAAFGADGFKVWNSADRDGVVEFAYRQAFPAGTEAGAYAFTARAHGNGLSSPPSVPVAVTVARFSLVTVSGAPVNAGGVPQPGAAWGGWAAVAGAQNAASANYLKVINDGDKADAAIVIDFTDSAFKGVTDPGYTIPIDGNVQFAWATGSPSAKPSDLTFTFLPTSASGSTTLAFAHKGEAAFVTYRIVQLPAVVDAQAYTAAFTVTEI